ncbi:MAG: hypothetical protein JNM59_13690 [Hyphomonadaceae bacterium]|nr:hypothetical protein [Hyphomonadaceae bacterium]
MKLTHALAAVLSAAALAACQQPAPGAPTETPATESADAVETAPAATPAPSLPCDIRAQRDWEAELGSNTPPSLTVNGTILLPRAGYSVSLLRDAGDTPDSTEPHLVLTVRPPSGPTAEVETPHAVRYFGPASAPYTTIHIMCDGTSLTDITVGR